MRARPLGFTTPIGAWLEATPPLKPSLPDIHEREAEWANQRRPRAGLHPRSGACRASRPNFCEEVGQSCRECVAACCCFNAEFKKVPSCFRATVEGSGSCSNTSRVQREAGLLLASCVPVCARTTTTMMSGEPILLTLEAPAEAPGSFPDVLKKIMEMPPPNILAGDDDTDKEKLCLGDNVDMGVGGSEMGPSAALTPAIWEKTIPYDGENFHLEYMDLEEFLMENGIPTEENSQKSSLEDGKTKTAKASPSSTNRKPVSVSTLSLLPIDDLDQCEEEVVIISNSETEITSEVTAEVTTDKDRATPEPIDPEEIEIEVNYEPDPTDLVLSSVPGGELFDPRKHKFSDEELKPQPMIKKAKKVFVPEEQKDDKYWQRRKKNNVAAKRSRDARRLKENQITVRAAFLERENAALRTEVADLRKDANRFKNIASRYEAKFGKLLLPEDE